MKITCSIWLMLILLSCVSKAQTIEVPIENQVPIFLKILTLDRNQIKEYSGTQLLKIAIVYQSKYRTSLNAMEAFKSLLEKSSIELYKKQKVFDYDFDSHESLSSFLSKNSIDVIVLAPLRAVEIGEIVESTKKNQVTSFSMVPSYVYSGISIGLETKGEKPLIIINLKSAKAEGSDFSSQLLKLVKIIE